MRSRRIIEAVPLFSETLNAEELDTLDERLLAVDFDRGHVLIREDDPGSSMFLIASGEVAVTTGDKKKVATLGAGAVIGEMSLLTGERRSATVTATSPVRAFEVTRSAMAQLFERSPRLVDRFAAILDRRQAELDALYQPGAASGTKVDFAARIRRLFRRD